MLQLVGSWRIRPAVRITSTGWKPVPLSERRRILVRQASSLSLLAAPLPYFVVSSRLCSVLPAADVDREA